MSQYKVPYQSAELSDCTIHTCKSVNLSDMQSAELSDCTIHTCKSVNLSDMQLAELSDCTIHTCKSVNLSDMQLAELSDCTIHTCKSVNLSLLNCLTAWERTVVIDQLSQLDSSRQQVNNRSYGRSIIEGVRVGQPLPIFLQICSKCPYRTNRQRVVK